MKELNEKLKREYLASQEVEGLLLDLVEDLTYNNKVENIPVEDIEVISNARKQISKRLDEREEVIEVVSKRVEGELSNQELINSEIEEIKNSLLLAGEVISKDIEKLKKTVKAKYEIEKRAFEKKKEENDGDYFKPEKELAKDVGKEVRGAIDNIYSRVKKEYEEKESISFEEMEKKLEDNNDEAKKDSDKSK